MIDISLDAEVTSVVPMDDTRVILCTDEAEVYVVDRKTGHYECYDVGPGDIKKVRTLKSDFICVLTVQGDLVCVSSGSTPEKLCENVVDFCFTTFEDRRHILAQTPTDTYLVDVEHDRVHRLGKGFFGVVGSLDIDSVHDSIVIDDPISNRIVVWDDLTWSPTGLVSYGENVPLCVVPSRSLVVFTNVNGTVILHDYSKDIFTRVSCACDDVQLSQDRCKLLFFCVDKLKFWDLDKRCFTDETIRLQGRRILSAIHLSDTSTVIGHDNGFSIYYQ